MTSKTRKGNLTLETVIMSKKDVLLFYQIEKKRNVILKCILFSFSSKRYFQLIDVFIIRRAFLSF
jgi:hypothetical protein